MRLIDADALIGYFHTQFLYESRDRSRVYKAIQEQPTIEERKKGKWIQPVPRRNVLAYSRAYSECDQCHEVIYLGNEMKYCPNCGADMRGEE